MRFNSKIEEKSNENKKINRKFLIYIKKAFLNESFTLQEYIEVVSIFIRTSGKKML